jgi:hypothetical protein
MAGGAIRAFPVSAGDGQRPHILVFRFAWHGARRQGLQPLGFLRFQGLAR